MADAGDVTYSLLVDDDERPILALTGSEAAAILGVPSDVYGYHLIAKGRLP